MHLPLITWLKNIPIARKLYFVMGIMALLIAVELYMLYFTIQTLSATRAFVGGEGLWSKAQKDAVYYLNKYAFTHNEADYQQFLFFLNVQKGDKMTRLELEKENTDLAIARKGFLLGRNHPDDIENMINLFRRFRKVYYINKAISIWAKGDSLISDLRNFGEKLHMEISSGRASPVKIAYTLAIIDGVNQQLTDLEDKFSYTLGEGSRWLEGFILRTLFFIALTVESSGLFLTIMVSLGISKGIKEIISVSQRVAESDFGKRAKVFSKDEIGQLAASFNNMADDLQKKISESEQYAERLKESNRELEHFASMASHDLREPLRTVRNYILLLEEQYQNQLKEGAGKCIHLAVDGVKRMELLINDLLEYSKISSGKPELESTDCSLIIDTVKMNLINIIRQNNAVITVMNMPVVRANPSQITRLFQNLISNAIKFRSEKPPEINISSRERAADWLFSVSDNGIGINSEDFDKLFIIFHRLHSRNDYDGAGIGLSTCKKIVEQAGGKIWIESEKGIGSTFYFTIAKS